MTRKKSLKKGKQNLKVLTYLIALAAFILRMNFLVLKSQDKFLMMNDSKDKFTFIIAYYSKMAC
ncbi:MAG: hypothetical protein ACJAUH_000881 [Saprospiraceae bacterium]|jgi:hypothetical protein